jgi:hypothetical protein
VHKSNRVTQVPSDLADGVADDGSSVALGLVVVGVVIAPVVGLVVVGKVIAPAVGLSVGAFVGLVVGVFVGA